VPTDRIPELVLSRIWNEGWHNREMRTTEGYRVGVVYRGVWTHSNGPDFRDAMLEIDGQLVTGSVELHIRSSDWRTHRHTENPDYDGVVLHVVLNDDGAPPVCGPSGRVIPTLWIEPFLNGPVEDFLEIAAPVSLGDIGARTCLPTLAGGRPDAIHAVLRREGWLRMQAKQLRLQQEMQLRPPGDVLYRSMLDSFGLSGNRQGMEAVADVVPLALAEILARKSGIAGLCAAYMGVAGFLPLAPVHGAIIAGTMNRDDIERIWDELAREMGLARLPAPGWSLNRVRPLNHPARRLASMASLISNAPDDGLLATVMNLPLDGGIAWDAWLARADPPIGESRRQQMIVNTIAPFVAAYAELNGDEQIMEHVGDSWELLAGRVDDDVARKTLRQITGGRRLPIRSALEIQGLHQIGRHGCARLRCFECPIAGLAVRFEETPLSG
jgi:hypothetical protein